MKQQVNLTNLLLKCEGVVNLQRNFLLQRYKINIYCSRDQRSCNAISKVTRQLLL